MTKYVVTDPCYILSDQEWDETFAPGDCEQQDCNTEQMLEKITGSKAWVSGTGFGDWSNEIAGDNVIQKEFFADSGTVCVCEYTDAIKERLEAKKSPHCAAIFETNGKISVCLNQEDPNWTVVEIQDEDGNYWQSLSAGYYHDCED